MRVKSGSRGFLPAFWQVDARLNRSHLREAAVQGGLAGKVNPKKRGRDDDRDKGNDRGQKHGGLER